MNEDEGLNIDISRLFPEAVKRVEILERLKRFWPSVVGIRLSRWSTPVILGVNELTVEASNSQAVNMLSKMNGNVKRALLSMGYETDGNFSLKIVYHRKSEKNPSKRKTIVKKIETNEERVAQYMSGAPESLPEDINRAVSHLRDYLEDRRRKFNDD